MGDFSGPFEPSISQNLQGKPLMRFAHDPLECFVIRLLKQRQPRHGPIQSVVNQSPGAYRATRGIAAWYLVP